VHLVLLFICIQVDPNRLENLLDIVQVKRINVHTNTITIRILVAGWASKRCWKIVVVVAVVVVVVKTDTPT
jgi:hypothetical protein